MELTWQIKLRIALAAVVGVVLVGILAWPSASQPDPFGSLLVQSLGIRGLVTLLIMAFLAGFIAYFVAWPYGHHIGVLAVPFGLALWGLRCGSIGSLMQYSRDITARTDLLKTLQWHSFLWLGVVAIGLAGVITGQKIRQCNKEPKDKKKEMYKYSSYINPVIILIASVIIVHFLIGLFAKDVVFSDSRLGPVISQPALGQIVFSVIISFGIVAFAAKKLLDVSYFWPAIASAFITIASASIYVKRGVLSRMMENWPAIFYCDAVISIFPLQFVAFGVIGSISGYWMAVRCQYWRKTEHKQA